MLYMITPGQVINKIRKHGSESLNHSERVFVVEVFRAAALTGRKELLMVKHDIQKAHLEYCLSLTEAQKK
jgi:hypothetical protein